MSRKAIQDSDIGSVAAKDRAVGARIDNIPGREIVGGRWVSFIDPEDEPEPDWMKPFDGRDLTEIFPG